jgi:integrase
MATVFKRGKMWGIRFMVDGRDFREMVGPSKRDAERALAARRTQVFEGKFFDKRQRCAVTLSEFRPDYLAQARLRKRSWERDALALRNLCASDLGSLKLDEIGLAEVREYQDARISGRLNFRRLPTPRTVNLEVKTLLRVLNVAVEAGALAQNKLRGKLNKQMLAEAEGRVRYLTASEAGLLVHVCAPHIRQVVELALLTGMRRGELTGLRWSEVDLRRGVIHLPGSRTKNGRSRDVPLNGEARRVLTEREQARPEGADRVFCRPDGSPLGNLRRAFEGACHRAGLKNFRFHDLRHCFCSALAQRGVPLQTIAELAGHRTLVMAQRYAHLSPQVLQGAVEQAARFFSPASSQPSAALALVPEAAEPEVTEREGQPEATEKLAQVG